MGSDKLTYRKSGVDTSSEEAGLARLATWIEKTREFRRGPGESILELGYFAGVIRLDAARGLAISTDGVGTKILLAQLQEKYDTIGIDCVAMNVNDLICVGAEPLAMVDYLAIGAPDEMMLEQLAKGLYEGARQARITIPGGEIAQVGEMIQGAKRGKHFDLVGTAVGSVDINRLLLGQDVKKGDAVVGIQSTGLHSNGFTLARKALLTRARLSLDEYMPDLSGTLGDALLEPTAIYVAPVMDILSENLEVSALINITGGGFLNLLRVKRPAAFELNSLPHPPPLFSLVQRSGNISDAEMHSVFNMGIGFCIVCRQKATRRVMDIVEAHHWQAVVVGRVVDIGTRSVKIPDRRLRSSKEEFISY